MPASWVSWHGIVHGGILAAMMDEAMGWAVAQNGWTGLTARLTVDLYLPVTPGQRLITRTAADLRTPDGTLVARARAHVLLTRDLPHVAVRS
ncbi:MAG TPA: PaaI family thioesterase [bacterium]|nr:PaaI family thioesterase [bacterium]